MAETNLNSGRKLLVYAVLFRLNRSFASIVRNLQELDEERIFKPKTLAALRGLTQELQAETNQHLLDTLNAVELADWHRFGKVRIARDKQLK